ncbi:MAG TPA: GrpB family protein [Dehalococcoidia bacterium]|nr:GrpB family protein [Dehalococcoidia bacterium]
MTAPATTIVLADYTPAWAELFAEERDRLQEAIGQWAAAIEHVGSTAIPGIAAKPIVDIGVALHDLGDAIKCITPLVEMGYECKGEFGIPERIYFRKPTDEPLPGQINDGVGRTHQIHMYQRDHHQFIWHIAFRDYLRAHAEERDAYEALKRRLAIEHAGDIEAYAEAKGDFVQGVLRKAGVPAREASG